MIVRRRFRSNDYEFEVAVDATNDRVRLIVATNVDSGVETHYSGFGTTWKRSGRKHQVKDDYVLDTELAALLCEVATEACPA